MSRIIISGRGMVTPLGATRTHTLAALAEGRRVNGSACPELADSEFKEFKAAPEAWFDPAERIDAPKLIKFMSRQGQLAAAAALEALAEAGLDGPAPGRPYAPERIGLYAGIGMAAADLAASSDLLASSLDAEGAFDPFRFGRQGLGAINPLWSFHILPNMPACIVSILADIQGPSQIFTPWEDQSGAALLEAVKALEQGDVDCAVVLAADTPAHPANLADLARLGLILKDECAANAGACLVLERSGGRAIARGKDRKTLPALSGLSLEASPPGTPPEDPLSPYLGRTFASAPLLLAALADELDIKREIRGSGGQTFRLEVTPCDV